MDKKKQNRMSKELKADAAIWVERITRLREARKWTQAELADKLNDTITGMLPEERIKYSPISEKTLSTWISERSVPTLNGLVLLAKTLDVSIDYLVGLSDNAKTENKEIGNLLGLSDASIAKLAETKKVRNRTSLTTLNYLISNPALLQHLEEYLMSFLMDEIANSDFKFIPLKKDPSEHYQEFAYSALMHHLPLYAKEMQADLREDRSLIRNLIAEYLTLNIDEEARKKLILMLEQDCASDDEDTFESTLEALSQWETDNPDEAQAHWEEVETLRQQQMPELLQEAQQEQELEIRQLTANKAPQKIRLDSTKRGKNKRGKPKK